MTRILLSSMMLAVHIWKRKIQLVACLPAAYQSLIIQCQQILQKAMIAPDQIEWKDVCDSEMGTLERMKCWKVVDESTMPPAAELIDPKLFLKQMFENGKFITQGTSGYKRVSTAKDF